MRRLLTPVTAIALWAALAAPAGAGAITFQFSGLVTQVNTDPDDPFGQAIVFGTPFSGSYTFDSAAADLIGAPTDGSYSSPGGGISVDFDGDPFGAFDLTGVIVNTHNGAPDQYGMYSSDGTLTIEFLLEALFANPLADDQLPLSPPNLASFESRVFTFRSDDLDGNQVEILGTIDSLTGRQPSPVPQPAAIWMVALGVATALTRRLALSRPV
jgi:hypothetical protein